MRLRLASAALALTALAACNDGGTGPGETLSVELTAAAPHDNGAGSVQSALSATVRNGNGTAVAGRRVEFRVLSGGGSVAPSTVDTDAGGVGAAVWTLGPPPYPAQRVEARVTDASGRVLAADTASPAPVTGSTRIAAVGSTTRTGVGGTVVADSLAVRVTDAVGSPVAGVPVLWAASSGYVRPDTTLTRADGTARAQWTLGHNVADPRAFARLLGQDSTVVFSATVTPAAITITASQPVPGALVHDTVRIQATTSSPSEVLSLAAALADRQVAMTVTGPGAWEGRLILTGVPSAPREIVLTATNAAGQTSQIRVPVVLDRVPILTAELPVDGTVARPTVRLKGRCQDDHGCEVFGVLWQNQGAFGATQVDTTVSLEFFDGTQTYFVFTGRDSVNAASYALQRYAFVELSPRWAEVAAGGNHLLDFDATRVLALDSARKVMVVVSRATGAPLSSYRIASAREDVGTPPVEGARLTPRGFVYSGLQLVYEIRDGAQIPSDAATDSSVRFAGRFVGWSSNLGTFVRSLDTGVTTSVPQRCGKTLSLAANGVAVCAIADTLYRIQDGSAAVLARAFYTTPTTDGEMVVAARYSAGANVRIVVVGPGGVEEALTGDQRSRVIRMNAGWTAFLRDGADLVPRVWTRAPDGTLQQRSATGSPDLAIQAVGPAGEVVYSTGGRRYLVPAGSTTPVDIGKDWSALTAFLSPARIYFEGSELYTTLGRSAFRVTP